MFCDCLFTQDSSDQALQQTSWPWLPTLGSLPLIFSALMEISYLGRLVVTSSSATRIHDSLLRAAMGCRSCLGVSWGKFQLLPVFRIEDWTIFIHIWPPWPFFFIVRCRTTLPQPPGNGEGLNIHDPCRTVSTTVISSQINLQLCSQTILFAIQSLDSLVQSDHELILPTFCMLY